MDIVFCVDYTSSMLSGFAAIRAMIVIICRMILHMQSDARIGIIKFRSADDVWKIFEHGFTANINTIQQWLNHDEPGGVSADGAEAVGDALSAALNMDWRTNNQDEIGNEKLVILITDGAPNGLFTPLVGADPWIVSDQFLENDITLVVIGVGEGVIVCDDFYCALAKRTGGLYVPMVNFEEIFCSVMNLVCFEGDTFHQAFRQVKMDEIEKNSSFKYSYVKDRVNSMINECQTMNGIRKFFYSYYLFLR